MNILDAIIEQHFNEQIALEESLYRVIEEQLAEIGERDFIDARTLLIKTNSVLELHFKKLNESLDKLERKAVNVRALAVAGNGSGWQGASDPRQMRRPLSKILRDDYSALNLITMSYTRLHTAALALGSQEVAALALQHLENLLPLVVKIGDLMPTIVTQELLIDAPHIDPTIARIALKNTKLAWSRSQ